jgi:hypothetical protein
MDRMVLFSIMGSSLFLKNTQRVEGETLASPAILETELAVKPISLTRLKLDRRREQGFLFGRLWFS